MSMDPVEAMAQAIHQERQSAGFGGKATWEYEPADIRAIHLQTARAALSAFRQWLEAEGLAIVPKKATGAMFSAALQRDDHGDLYHGIYTAMISAAPDALKAFDGAPPSPGAITGIRKAADPCSDCIDGWCQMNCGPRVG